MASLLWLQPPRLFRILRLKMLQTNSVAHVIAGLLILASQGGVISTVRRKPVLMAQKGAFRNSGVPAAARGIKVPVAEYRNLSLTLKNPNPNT